jgi:Sulfotransferase domain
LEEAGFAEQAQLFELVTDTLARPAVVVDATDFRRDPERTMVAYCAAVGIEHREDALSWEAGAVPEMAELGRMAPRRRAEQRRSAGSAGQCRAPAARPRAGHG